MADDCSRSPRCLRTSPRSGSFPRRDAHSREIGGGSLNYAFWTHRAAPAPSPPCLAKQTPGFVKVGREPSSNLILHSKSENRCIADGQAIATCQAERPRQQATAHRAACLEGGRRRRRSNCSTTIADQRDGVGDGTARSCAPDELRRRPASTSLAPMHLPVGRWRLPAGAFLGTIHASTHSDTVSTGAQQSLRPPSRTRAARSALEHVFSKCYGRRVAACARMRRSWRRWSCSRSCTVARAGEGARALPRRLPPG